MNRQDRPGEGAFPAFRGVDDLSRCHSLLREQRAQPEGIAAHEKQIISYCENSDVRLESTEVNGIPPTRLWHSLTVPLPRAPSKRGLQHGGRPVRCAALFNTRAYDFSASKRLRCFSANSTYHNRLSTCPSLGAWRSTPRRPILLGRKAPHADRAEHQRKAQRHADWCQSGL